MDASDQANIGIVGYYDEEFPDVLRKTVNEEGKLDPPLLLWNRGNFSITQLPGFAVIGTREATPEGVAGGTSLAGEFAKRGFNIVSGLAIGCDACGHKGALKVGGKTTAILTNGLDHDSIYPPANELLNTFSIYYQHVSKHFQHTSSYLTIRFDNISMTSFLLSNQLLSVQLINYN